MLTNAQWAITEKTDDYMTYTNKSWPKEPTKFDLERIEKAKAKRERKAAKRKQPK